MITKLRDAAINTATKEAITELRDSFGGTMLVQTPILTGDHAKDVAEQTALLEANEAAFIAKLKLMGLSDAEIEAMKQ